MTNLLYKEEVYFIVGICMNIHATLGMGLKEINYKDVFEIELQEHDIIYEREKRFLITYKQKVLKNPYIADFIVFDKIIVEIKSVPVIHPAHIAQALSYLTVSRLKLALLINFGERSLTFKRIIR